MPYEGDPCELIWKKISNARLDGSVDEERRLKELARAFDCGSRPSTIPVRRYPEVEDVDPPTPPPFSVAWYRIGHAHCANDPASIFSQAGTKDPEAAAAWYVDQNAAGDEAGRAGLLQGCLDALRGLEPLNMNG